MAAAVLLGSALTVAVAVAAGAAAEKTETPAERR